MNRLANAFEWDWDSEQHVSYFHHNGGITNWDDRYQTQYHNLADLADLNQHHPAIDAYLKDSAD